MKWCRFAGLVALFAVVACKQPPSVDSLLAAAPLPEYGVDDFAVHPGLGIPTGRRHLLVAFKPEADGAAVADALAKAGVSIAGGHPEALAAFVTVPEDRGWEGLDAAQAALAQHPAVAAAAFDLIESATLMPPARGAKSEGSWWVDAIAARQAWNAVPALRWLHAQRSRAVTVAVIDTGFRAHPDLDGVLWLRSPESHPRDTDTAAWHGSFDAGLIGAKWNGRDIDGVVPDPLAQIDGLDTHLIPSLLGMSHGDYVASSGGMLRAAVLRVANQAGGMAIVNYSMGYNWYAGAFRRDCDGNFIECRAPEYNNDTMCDPSGGHVTGCNIERVREAIDQQGLFLASWVRSLSRNRRLLLFCSAGNDAARWPGFPAELSSSCANAALRHGSPDMIVVGSRTSGKGHVIEEHDGSNSGSQLLAPGVGIESLQSNSGVISMTGTSFATPIAAGSAAFLLALNPDLLSAEIRRLLTIHSPQVRDPRGGVTARPVLDLRRAVEAMTVKLADGSTVSGDKLLADIDDGTDDGFSRRVVPGARPREWSKVRVDMRDMRAFRDMWWLTRANGGVTIACPAGIPACDLNGDGRFAAPDEPHSRAALVGPDVDDAALAAFAARWDGDGVQPFSSAELRDLLHSADVKIDGRAFILQANTSATVDGLKISLAGRMVPGGAEARHAALRELKIGTATKVLTTPGLGSPEVEVQAMHGDTPVGRVYRARFADLEVAEDRTLVLNPCAWESDPEISILEPWTTVDCSDDGKELVHVNVEGDADGTVPHKLALTKGEPHLVTFDGLAYDFQAAGEFVLFSDGEVEVQTRQQAMTGRGDVSVNAMIAARVGGQRVVVRRGAPDRVWLDGQERALAGELALEAGRLTRNGRELTLTWRGGDVMRVVVHDDLVDVELGILPRPGRVHRGLLGSTPNDDPLDDLVGSDGKVYVQPDVSALYRGYGDGWRVTQAESLLHYEPGETTETFTERAFPRAQATLADLAPDVLASATARCAEAGIRQRSLLEACILDVALLGRDDAAFGFVGLPDPRAEFRPAHVRADFEVQPQLGFFDPKSVLVPRTERAPGGPGWPATRFFGPFGASVQLGDAPGGVFGGLPPHDAIELSFDVIVLGEWRGDAVIETRTKARVVTRASYSTGDAPQSFPGTAPGASYPGSTGALGRDVLGLGVRDAVFRHRVVFQHTDPSLTLHWLAHGVGEGQRWGIDNVEINTRKSPLRREPVDIGGVIVTLEHGEPLAPGVAGCADGTREAFHDAARHPDRAGCVAAWDGPADLRARPTGAACGDGLGPCKVPADACAAGWHVCGTSGELAELQAFDPVVCSHTAGDFLGASSTCAGDDACADPPASGLPCAGEGARARAFCCGSEYLCTDMVEGCALSPRALVHGAVTCAGATSNPGRGVLCCRD